MNKLIKGLLIAAGVLTVAGLAFGTSGVILAGGLDALTEQAAAGQLNYNNWHFEDGFYWTSEDGEIVIDAVDVIKQDVVSIAMESDKFTYEDGVKNLVISTQLGDIEIETTDDVSVLTVKIEDARMKYFSQELQGDTLYIDYEETGVSLGMADAPEISIQVPKDWTMDSITADTNLGNVEINGFKKGCTNLDLHTDLGNVEVEECKVEGTFNGHTAMGDVKIEDTHCMGADLSTDMGNVKFYGKTEGDLNLKTSMGNVKAKLEGNEEDYNVELDTDMGNATYESDHHSEEHHDVGGHYEHHRDGAMATVCLESSMGDVELTFED